MKEDEPTLETETPKVEPADGATDSTVETQIAAGSGWGSRLERMTAAKRERRRKLIARFWLVAVPVLMLVVAMVLLAVYGGQSRGDSSTGTTAPPTQAAVEGSALLMVEADGVPAVAVLLQPWDEGGVVLAIPGVTLLEGQGSFQTLAEMHKTGGLEAAKGALASALAMAIGPAAVVEWQELRSALADAGLEDLPEVIEVVAQGEAIARAVRDLVAGSGAGGPPNTLDEMRLDGEADGFLQAVRLDAESMTANVWTAGALGGSVVDGDGFWYLEPDIQAARALLIVTSEPAVTSVEIKDGAGIEGAARMVGSLLESAGFELAPMSYAQDYPSVQQTQIFCSPQGITEAQQVQSILGLGEIVEDASLGSHRMVVVLGKDYEVASNANETTTTSVTEGLGQ